MKHFLFLLAACVCPNGFQSTVSADESRSIGLEADAIVQETEVTTSPAETDDPSVESEVSITTTVNPSEEPVERNVQDAADDGTDSAPETEVVDPPSPGQIVIRLGGTADEDSAFATIVDDPQAKVQMDGKIVIIGPDGKRQEFAISGHEAGKVFKIVTVEEATGNEDQHAGHIDTIVRIMQRDDASGTTSDAEPMGEARMAIGVQCECVPDALRSHLDLNETGIMVVHVREQSPASDAALMKFDIIVQTGDTDVKTTEDLVSAVAASDGKELTLSIIRHGEPMKVVVTPRKMEFPVVLAPAQAGLFHGDLNSQSGVNFGPNPAWQSLSDSVKKQLESEIAVQNSVRKFHPGIVIEKQMPSNEKDMQRLIEHARKLAEESGKVARIRTQKNLVPDESATPRRNAESIEALRGQVRTMEQKLVQLEKRLASEEEGKK